ncbi:Pyrokinin-1 receptor [Araneus ventricosus]|uniref:Pyrokinin-1 receptor n=1 Tax=Araneus ventricosus TaxID=182803 RepID=A0A4Y2FIW6_ARAVE|nr:Pyrokinin-1 receptor [Araneus ventricosus]
MVLSDSGRCKTQRFTKYRGRIIRRLQYFPFLSLEVAVVVSFFICWSPFHAQRLMADYVPATPTPLFDMAYTVIRHISGVTYYLSPTVNPILYQLMSLKFQQAFKDTFGPFSKCLRGEAQMTEMAPVTTNVPTECSRVSTRIRRSPYGSPQTTAFNI